MPFEQAKLACTLPWEDDWVTAVAFAGAGRTVVAGNKLGGMLAWKLPEAIDAKSPPSPAYKLAAHTNAVTHLVALPDGKLVVSASLDHTVALWDLSAASTGTAKVVLDAEVRARNAKKNGARKPELPEVEVGILQPMKVWTEHREWVQAMALSRDGTLLATGDDAGEVIVRELPAGRIVSRFKTRGWISALAISPDGKTLAVAERIPLDGDRFRALHLWDIAAAKQIANLMRAFEKKEHEFCSADFSPDGKVLAVAQGDDEIDSGRAFLLDVAGGKKVGETKGTHLNGLRCARFSKDGKHLLTSGRDTTVRVWNAKDGSAVKEIGTPRGGQFKDWLCAFALNADETLLAGADMAGAVQLWTL